MRGGGLLRYAQATGRKDRIEMASRQHRQPSGADPGPETAPYSSSAAQGAVWIETPFQATVRGRSQSGEQFRVDTVLDGLSPAFLALRLPYLVEAGRRLFVVIWLRAPSLRHMPGSGVASRGVVASTDLRPGGVWRVVVALSSHRFIYARQG